MTVIDMIDYTRLKLDETTHWTWSLHPNQGYLGRVVLILNRSSTGSLVQLRSDEWISLRDQLTRYERLLDHLFDPDRYNYTQLGNEWDQTHVHAIPRYKTPRKWHGREFVDRRWGENPSPKFKSPLSIEETYLFAAWLRDQNSSFDPTSVRDSSARKRATR